MQSDKLWLYDGNLSEWQLGCVIPVRLVSPGWCDQIAKVTAPFHTKDIAAVSSPHTATQWTRSRGAVPCCCCAKTAEGELEGKKKLTPHTISHDMHSKMLHIKQWLAKLHLFSPLQFQRLFRNQLFSRGLTWLLSVCKPMIQPSSLQMDSDN